jgi:hypothetical protein
MAESVDARLIGLAQLVGLAQLADLFGSRAASPGSSPLHRTGQYE